MLSGRLRSLRCLHAGLLPALDKMAKSASMLITAEQLLFMLLSDDPHEPVVKLSVPFVRLFLICLDLLYAVALHVSCVRLSNAQR